MQKIDLSVEYNKAGWDVFFKNRGKSWRYKDYIFLEEVFNIQRFHGHVLDVGCALGDGIEYLSNRCRNITEISGTDYSEYAIEQCRSRFNNDIRKYHFFQSDIHNPLKGRYDVILCLQTLEHLKDPQQALENLVAATDDLLIVSTPFKNRRIDESHVWSFDETDFSIMTEHKIAQRSKNIFWLYSKKSNYHFRRLPGAYHYWRKVADLFGFRF